MHYQIGGYMLNHRLAHVWSIKAPPPPPGPPFRPKMLMFSHICKAYWSNCFSLLFICIQCVWGRSHDTLIRSVIATYASPLWPPKMRNKNLKKCSGQITSIILHIVELWCRYLRCTVTKRPWGIPYIPMFMSSVDPTSRAEFRATGGYIWLRVAGLTEQSSDLSSFLVNWLPIRSRYDFWIDARRLILSNVGSNFTYFDLVKRLKFDPISLLINCSCKLGPIMTRYDFLKASYFEQLSNFT